LARFGGFLLADWFGSNINHKRPPFTAELKNNAPMGLKSTVYGALLYSPAIYRGADQAKRMSDLII
jgi:hypothetical protein